MAVRGYALRAAELAGAAAGPVTSVALLVAGCGVKNDLVKPNGQSTPKDTPDPSKPPYPIGR